MKALTPKYSLPLIGLLILAACGGPSEAPASSSVTPAEPSTPQVQPSTMTSTPSSGTTPSSSGSATQAPGSPAGSPGAIVVQPGSDRKLHLTDAYDRTSHWEEHIFQAVGQDKAQAIGAEIYCNGSQSLEFRFSNTDGTFKATVAQDIDSSSSSNILEWSMIVDGQQVEAKQIAFKDTAEFSTPLAGVAVVRLETETTGKCERGATGLITSAVVQG